MSNIFAWKTGSTASTLTPFETKQAQTPMKYNNHCDVTGCMGKGQKQKCLFYVPDASFERI